MAREEADARQRAEAARLGSIMTRLDEYTVALRQFWAMVGKRFIAMLPGVRGGWRLQGFFLAPG